MACLCGTKNRELDYICTLTQYYPLISTLLTIFIKKLIFF